MSGRSPIPPFLASTGSWGSRGAGRGWRSADGSRATTEGALVSRAPESSRCLRRPASALRFIRLRPPPPGPAARISGTRWKGDRRWRAARSDREHGDRLVDPSMRATPCPHAHPGTRRTGDRRSVAPKPPPNPKRPERRRASPRSAENPSARGSGGGVDRSRIKRSAANGRRKPRDVLEARETSAEPVVPREPSAESHPSPGPAHPTRSSWTPGTRRWTR